MLVYVHMCVHIHVVYFLFLDRVFYVSLAALELYIPLPHLTKCCDYRHAPCTISHGQHEALMKLSLDKDGAGRQLGFWSMTESQRKKMMQIMETKNYIKFKTKSYFSILYEIYDWKYSKSCMVIMCLHSIKNPKTETEIIFFEIRNSLHWEQNQWGETHDFFDLCGQAWRYSCVTHLITLNLINILGMPSFVHSFFPTNFMDFEAIDQVLSWFCFQTMCLWRGVSCLHYLCLNGKILTISCL